MASNPPVALMLGRERTRLFLRFFLLQGPGGPLLLLWSIGAGIFLFMFGLPIYALAWTSVVVALGFLTILVYRGNREVWEQLLHSSVAERLPWNTLSDQALRVTVQKSANVFVELALKVYGFGSAGDDLAELDRVLAAASGLLSLQYGLARNAEDLAHGLTFMVPDGPVGTDLITEAPTVRQGTVDAVQKEVNQARALAGDIGQQLEMLLLRVFQIEKLPNPVSGASGLAQDIEATLARAQEKVDSLHQGASSLAGSHIPPELRALMGSLQYGFSRNRSTQGLKNLHQLAYEYTELQLVLERRKVTGSLSVAQIPKNFELNFHNSTELY